MANNKKHNNPRNQRKPTFSNVNSSNKPMTVRSPLDILIHTAKQNSSASDHQSLQALLNDTDPNMYSRREGTYNELGQRVINPPPGYRAPDARIAPDTLPGTRVTTQAYESSQSSKLKNLPQLANVYLANRNFEMQNRKKYAIQYPTLGAPQPTYKAPLSHTTLPQIGKHAPPGYNTIYSPYALTHNAATYAQSSNVDPSASARRPNNEHLFNLSKIDKAERVKQIDSKLEYLHNLYTRQRNLYISTYKANNDLISEAFSTIKYLKDELVYVRNNCVCNYNKAHTKDCKEHINSNDTSEVKLSEDKDKDKEEDVTINVSNDNKDIIKEDKDENYVEEENEEIEPTKKAKLSLSEEDRKDIEDQQEAELIVGRYRKNKN